MDLVIIKIVISVAMVLSLVFISERSPKFGGLLSGLPLGVGILMFFYAYQEGVSFAVGTVPYAIAGLSSSLFFVIGFYMGARLFPSNKILNVLSAVFLGAIIYFLVSLIISSLKINLVMALIMFFSSMVIAIIFFLHVPSIQQGISAKKNFIAILFRIVLATLMIVGVTESVSIIGPKWAGILASFPAMMSSVIIILLYSYQNALFPNVLKHFSYSISILALYELLVMWLYPSIGIALGTLLAYSICFVYLYLLSQIGRLRKIR